MFTKGIAVGYGVLIVPLLVKFFYQWLVLNDSDMTICTIIALSTFVSYLIKFVLYVKE